MSEIRPFLNVGDEIPLGDIQTAMETEKRPEDQSYFMRTDTRTVVKSESEYTKTSERGVPMRIIPFSYAVQLLKEEEARHKKKIKARRKQKVARKARKVNRK